MNIPQHIRKIGIAALWIVLASGLLVLLAAAVKTKDRKNCTGVQIEIAGIDGDYCFLDKQDVMEILGNKEGRKMTGQGMATIPIRQLETTLEKNIWVKDAELFFDNNLVLHILINEREPIARVFTVSGNSFYIDSSGKKLPLGDKMKVRLPVFTGFAWEKTSGIGKKGAKTVKDMKNMAGYILHNPFWCAQIAQVDITGDGQFELVPTVGNHLIAFGDGEAYEQKFQRLFVFYREVLSKTGFDKYSRVDLRYDQQVVGTRRGSSTKIDSAQAMRNIEKMILAAMAPLPDTNQTNNN